MEQRQSPVPPRLASARMCWACSSSRAGLLGPRDEPPTPTSLRLAHGRAIATRGVPAERTDEESAQSGSRHARPRGYQIGTEAGPQDFASQALGQSGTTRRNVDICTGSYAA